MVSSPYGSPMSLVFRDIRFITKLEGVTPSQGVEWGWGGYELAIFRPLSRCISETVQDTTRLLSITNRKSNSRFRLVPKSTTLVDPEMTLDGNYAFCCIYTHVFRSHATTKIWMKIEPYYQRQKCSPGILVSSKIIFMRIFAGVRWRWGVKWEWRGRKWRFSLLSVAISSEPSHLRQHLL